MNIGKAIKNVRESAGMTQEALGKKFGRTKQWVSNIETGKTQLDIETLILVSEAMGCNIMAVLKNADPDVYDEWMNRETGSVPRQAENAERGRKPCDDQDEDGMAANDDAVNRKRGAAKTIIDMMDEDQLDALLKFLISK